MSINSKYNLSSAKELIGEFLFDFDIQNSQIISSINRHIARGIELCNIDTYYKRCKSKIDIQENRGILPCNGKYIELIFLDMGGRPYVVNLSNNNLSLLNSFNRDFDLYSEAYIENNVLTLGGYEGSAYVIYKALPQDSEGYVQFPDDPYLKEALLYFIIHKLGLSGFKHKVISRQEAEQKWNQLYPQARNSVNFPTVHDMQRFTEHWNNPLKGVLYNNLFE